MERMRRSAKKILFDTAGVLLIIASPFTGVLPGPGGIPVFLIGLGLLSVHHDWAKRYLETIRNYADQLGDFIFTPERAPFFDITAPLLVLAGVLCVIKATAWWMVTIGVILACLGFVTFFANRHRWQRLTRKLRRKL